MTPDELRSLADEATPGPWNIHDSGSHIYIENGVVLVTQIDASHDRWEQRGLVEKDARLIALAPDLARLCAEMGEALDWIEASPENPLKVQFQARVALAQLSELEAK
jgi:hypothetical protein